MTKSMLDQGQSLSALMLPDYNAEGAMPFKAGQSGVTSITVTQLAGPMGWYDCAEIKFDNETPIMIVPLHQCEFIAN